MQDGFWTEPDGQSFRMYPLRNTGGFRAWFLENLSWDSDCRVEFLINVAKDIRDFELLAAKLWEEDEISVKLVLATETGVCEALFDSFGPEILQALLTSPQIAATMRTPSGERTQKAPLLRKASIFDSRNAREEKISTPP